MFGGSGLRGWPGPGVRGPGGQGPGSGGGPGAGGGGLGTSETWLGPVLFPSSLRSFVGLRSVPRSPFPPDLLLPRTAARFIPPSLLQLVHLFNTSGPSSRGPASAGRTLSVCLRWLWPLHVSPLAALPPLAASPPIPSASVWPHPRAPLIAPLSSRVSSPPPLRPPPSPRSPVARPLRRLCPLRMLPLTHVAALPPPAAPPHSPAASALCASASRAPQRTTGQLCPSASPQPRSSTGRVAFPSPPTSQPAPAAHPSLFFTSPGRSPGPPAPPPFSTVPLVVPFPAVPPFSRAPSPAVASSSCLAHSHFPHPDRQPSFGFGS